MESFAYILILALAISTLFFAIAFRDPPQDRQIISQIPLELLLRQGLFCYGMGESSPFQMKKCCLHLKNTPG